MSITRKISAGFALAANEPVTSGIEDVIYVFNEDDMTLTYDAANPLLITGIAAVASGKLYKFEGTNNSFNATSKLVKTQVGPRYTETIDFNAAGLSTALKSQIQAMSYGRVKAIVINNYKSGDSSIELFGAANGLHIADAERNAADENLEGGYKLQLANPDKLREPYPPRAVAIAPNSGAATYASTLAALDALAI